MDPITIDAQTANAFMSCFDVMVCAIAMTALTRTDVVSFVLKMVIDADRVNLYIIWILYITIGMFCCDFTCVVDIYILMRFC